MIAAELVDGDQVIALSERLRLEDAPRGASMRLRFSRFLLPSAIARQTICVRPALDDVQTLGDCSMPVQAFTSPAYDPVHRAVVYSLPEDETWSADTTYRLTVFRADPDVDMSGIFSFDGLALDRRYVFDFSTASDEPALRPPPPNPDSYCDAQRCFAACEDEDCRRACAPLCPGGDCTRDGDLLGAGPQGQLPALFGSCAFSGCHAATDAAAGLDLQTIDGIRNTAWRVVARQTQLGEQAFLPEVTPSRFGRAMPLIAPGDPGNSYLLYKLILNPNNHLEGPSEAERERMQAAFVVGLPMPSALDGLVGRLAEQPVDALHHLERIRTWIAYGAPLSCP